ncbi:MAG: exodeoxyribonuclease VII large subunit [Salinivirgaceae bacterium]|nr:exodeoxyribonuclease VII large subunit [Salinivirgaceae bacterium]
MEDNYGDLFGFTQQASESALSLSQLLTNVADAVKVNFPSSKWVVAEVNSISVARVGHCYLELVEKSAGFDSKIVAQVRANIWANNYRIIKQNFEMATGESLRVGMKILAYVRVDFSPTYGLSLIVQDIDPQYTIGDLAQQRAMVIKQLQDDGVIDMNKQIELPIVVQRIAIISSDSAAGWGDFKNQIESNDYGYKFDIQLFPALMQGEKSPQSIIAALDEVSQRFQDFDAVAIIRGGGARTDLSCFDQYDLAFHIAQFPLPVLTGIGHERDDSVADLVAHTRLKTPTAVAAFIIDRAANFMAEIQELADAIFDSVKSKLVDCTNAYKQQVHQFEMIVNQLLAKEKLELDNLHTSLHYSARHFVDSETIQLNNVTEKAKTAYKLPISVMHNKLDNIKLQLETSVVKCLSIKEKELVSTEIELRLHNPEEVTKYGFAVVSSKGQFVNSVSQLTQGARISIKLKDGEVDSIVE